MTDKKRNRRKFIADLLFAGGAITGAAFISKYSSGEVTAPTDTPVPAGTPAPVETPTNCGSDQPLPGEVMIDGEIEMPEPIYSKGEAVAPQEHKDPFIKPIQDRPLPGRVAMPREQSSE